ncbi:MAG TPA: heparinase, partial [Cyclobacteriaceae bacterium]
PGELIIHYKVKEEKPRDFVIRYDAKQMQVAVEKIALTTMEDQGIIQKWGDTIYRINFKIISPKMNDTFRFEIAGSAK